MAIQDNAVLLEQHYYGRDAAFDRMRELGVSWVRVPVIWERVEREGFGQVDALVDAAQDEGFEVQLNLIPPAPAGATGDGKPGVFRPRADAFGEFAQRVASRYRSRVRRWSVWNEPNLVNWLRPVREMPSLYRALWDAGYRAIEGVDPDAQVLIGETAPYVRPGDGMAPLAFLRGVLRPGPLVADGYAHHSYDFEAPPEREYPGGDNVTLGSVERLLGALDRAASDGSLRDGRGRALDVWITEFGYFQTTGRALPPARRAAYVRRAFELAASHYPRVRQLLQYLLVSPPEGFPGGRFDTSLLTRDGSPTPAFGALAEWAREAAAAGRALPPPE